MKKTISFYLENENKKTSALWYIDIKDSSDIYIKNNITEDDLHFSQHKSNEAHDTFTEQFIEEHDVDYKHKNLVKIEVENYNDFSQPCLIWSYRTAGEEINAPSFTPHANSNKIVLNNNQLAEVFALRMPQIVFPDMSKLSFGDTIKYNGEDEYICIGCIEHINNTYILVLYRLLDYLDIFRKNFIKYKIEPVKKAKEDGDVLSGNRMLLLGEIKNRYVFGNEKKEQFGHVELYI